MLGRVARILLLAPAAGTVYWTVDDEVQKKSADIQTLQSQASELGEMQKSSSIVDNLFKGNVSILNIIQGALDDAKTGLERTALQVKGQNERVERATKESEAATDKLQKSIANAQDASADAKQANEAFNVSGEAVLAKEAVVQKAITAYTNAKAHLDDLISYNRLDETPAANADKEDKNTALEAAEAELKAAKKSSATQSETMNEAMELAQKRGVEQQEAQKALDDAIATLKHAQGALEKKKAQNAPHLLEVQRLSRSFDAQKSTVDSLKSESERMHRNLKLQQHRHDELQKMIADDSSCIDCLRNLQAKVQSAAAAYDAEQQAYAAAHSDELLQAAWGAKDSLDNFRLEFYEMQKQCAPQTVHIPDSAEPPPVCAKATGGSCSILWCYRSRHAYCDQATSSCLCSSDSCAVNGQCQSRGPPPAAALEEPAVPEQAEAPARGSLKIYVVVSAAVLVGMLVAAVQKRRDSRTISLTEKLIE